MDPYVEVISWIQASNSSSHQPEAFEPQEFSSSEEDDKPSEKSKHSLSGNESEDESEDDSDDEVPAMKNKFGALPAD